MKTAYKTVAVIEKFVNSFEDADEDGDLNSQY